MALVLPVFVYGTLRPGRVNWPVADPVCSRHEPASLPGFALYDLDYPCAVGAAPPGGPAPESSPTVGGDLLWISGDAEAALARLDEFEGYDVTNPDASYYVREQRTAVRSNGEEVEVWVYLPGPSLLAQVHERRRVPGDEWPG